MESHIAYVFLGLSLWHSGMPKNASLNSLDSAPRISRSHLMSKVSEKPNGSNSASLPQNQLNQSRNIQRFCCLGMLVVLERGICTKQDCFFNQARFLDVPWNPTQYKSIIIHQRGLLFSLYSTVDAICRLAKHLSTCNHVSSLPSRCPPNRRGWQASARKAWTCCCWHDVPLLQCDQWKPYRHGAGISLCW